MSQKSLESIQNWARKVLSDLVTGDDSVTGNCSKSSEMHEKPISSTNFAKTKTFIFKDLWEYNIQMILRKQKWDCQAKIAFDGIVTLWSCDHAGYGSIGICLPHDFLSLANQRIYAQALSAYVQLLIDYTVRRYHTKLN
jgi:hypothetical protein